MLFINLIFWYIFAEHAGESPVSDTTEECGQPTVEETKQIIGTSDTSNQDSSDSCKQNSIQSSLSQDVRLSDSDTTESHSSPTVIEQNTVVENEKQSEISDNTNNNHNINNNNTASAEPSVLDLSLIHI